MDSIINFYISNGKERENKIFLELSSKSTKSRDTFKFSSDRKGMSKSNLSVHSRTSVHSQPSAVHVVLAGKESQMHFFFLRF